MSRAELTVSSNLYPVLPPSLGVDLQLIWLEIDPLKVVAALEGQRRRAGELKSGIIEMVIFLFRIVGQRAHEWDE